MFYPTTLAMLSLLILAVSSSSAILSQQASTATTTTATGRFIVTLNAKYSHEHFEHFMTKPKLPSHHTTTVKKSMMEVHHRYSKTFHGLAVSGVTEEEIRKHPGVKDVHKDGIIRLDPLNAVPSTSTAAAYNWGLDRIDQLYLPLDGSSYNPAYEGDNVDIYIVDTGIDTTHVELAPNPSGRVVRNIYAAPGFSLSNNNDQVGHGTIVASIAGGNSVGTSPHANIFGLRVFGTSGEGLDTDAIGAIEHILVISESTGRRSVINLSLGSKF
jgi:Subtilase family